MTVVLEMYHSIVWSRDTCGVFLEPPVPGSFSNWLVRSFAYRLLGSIPADGTLPGLPCLQFSVRLVWAMYDYRKDGLRVDLGTAEYIQDHACQL